MPSSLLLHRNKLIDGVSMSAGMALNLRNGVACGAIAGACTACFARAAFTKLELMLLMV